MMEPHHTLQIKIQKTIVDYTNHSLDDSQIIVISLSPSLNSRERSLLQLPLGSVLKEKVLK